MVAERLRAGGVVRSVRAGSGGPTAAITVQAPATCPRCAEGRGCGAGLFGRRSRYSRIDVPVPDGIELYPGDAVSLDLDERDLLRASMLVYGWPLAGSVLGSVVAWFAGAGDSASALAALGGLAVGVVAARHRLRRAAPAAVRSLRVLS